MAATATEQGRAMEPADKPHSPSCDRNRDPILAVLRDHFMDRRNVLEIGSGTGQHAVFFAAALPHLAWQASDRRENLAGIRMWLDEAALPNTPPPLELDVNGAWPRQRFDAVFMANTLHIMSWAEVERLFAGLEGVLAADARLVVYGPFNYGGQFTSESNAKFDVWLKERGAHQGIRDFEAVDALARGIGLVLLEDRAMPANNRCLAWQRRGMAA
jgi:cyclopropane fatty-acyl-phospholipid synthase-like methyltransferase